MKAILNVFSGRPNPSWELSVEEVSELARRLLDLVPADQVLPEGGLGYSGLTLVNPGRQAGLPVQIHVFRGIVGLWENEHPTCYHDLHNVEGWLLDLARQQGYGAILDQVIPSSR